MRKNSRNFLRSLKALAVPAILSALALWLSGCSDELFQGDSLSDSVSELTLSIETEVPFGDFRTRGSDAMGNNDVRSLWVGVFDVKTGNRVGARHFSYPTSPVAVPVLYYDSHPEVVIVGVANYDGFTDWDDTPVREKLDAASTWNDFMDINVKAPLVGGSPVVDPSSDQIMMGMVCGADVNRPFYRKSEGGNVAIDNNSEFSVNLSPESLYGSMVKTIVGKKLYLRRLSSQVNVYITTGANAEVTDVSYRRCNISKGVFLAERPTYSGDVKHWKDFVAGTPNFADTRLEVSDGHVVNSDSYYSDAKDQWIRAGRDNSFSFIHYENRHWGVGTNPDHNVREALIDSERGILQCLQHEYNNYASYFVVRMTILDRARNRSARVDYVIHEGNINNTRGEYDASDNRARDFSAFRNMVYNYNIRVEGVDYITYNVSNSSAHHDAASGIIWEADATTLGNGNSATITIGANPNLLFRFFIGRGTDTAPTDYLDGNIPDGMDGMYWPAIDGNTVTGSIPYEISNRFTIRKNNSRGQSISVQQFINEARSSGGTYYITFNPPSTAEQWNPDPYKMGLYYYNPSEKSSLSGIDDDKCTSYSGRKFHVLEWKPSTKQPQTLNALTYNLPTATAKYTTTKYIDLDFSTAHNFSGNYSNGTYGTDYVYIVTVNGVDYTVAANKTCRIPLAAFGNGTSYAVHAEALNTRNYNSSTTTYKDITINNQTWDFSSNDFATWFRGHFYTNSGRYTAPQDLKKKWDDDFYVLVGDGKVIGRLYEDPPYLYMHNSGEKNGFNFTVYKNCKITIVTQLTSGGRNLVIEGANPDKLTPRVTNQLETHTTWVTLDEGEQSRNIKIYYTGGGGYFYSVSVSN